MTAPRRSRVTLADVARAAGVSQSTASRALNDSPRISKATKTRIRETARRIGFIPNAQGRALAVGRSETIAMLVTEPLSELFSDPTYGTFLEGISDRLSESEYLPVLLQASTEHEHNRVRRHFERRSFDAVIDISPYAGTALLDVLSELGIPTVLCGQLEGDPYRDVLSTVYSDDIEGARIAATAMLNRGRRRCVALLGPQSNPATLDRRRGYRQVLGASLPDDRIAYTGWSASDGFTAMCGMLERFEDIDGVLAGSDRIAAGVLQALKEHGLHVPQDVSVIGFDGHPIAATLTPRLTTIRQPLYEEGRVAADVAMRMIDGEKPSTTVMHMSLVVGESL